MLFRKAELGKADPEARTVPVVLATDYPVTRDGYTEILDIARADLSRGDLPLIESHDATRLNIGVIRNIQIDGNKLRGLAVFGQSARASEVLADVMAGIVTGVSIGYQTDEGRPMGGTDKTARQYGFMPFEASVVSIPADPTAGFFRSRPTLTLNKTPGKNIMNDTNTQTLEIRNHAQEISAIAAGIPGGAELAMRAIADGKTTEQFQQILIRSMSNSPIPTGDLGPNVQVNRDADVMRILRSAGDIRAHYTPNGKTASQTRFIDFVRGAFRMKTTTEAQRDLSIGTDTAGGYTVPNALMPGILEGLFPASSLIQAGAGVIPLNDGAKSFNFAALDTKPAAAWRSENQLIEGTDPTFKNISVTPRSLSFMVTMSRELVADSPNAEQAVQQAVGQAFAAELDRAGLIGTGVAPVPRGLKNTSGIQTVSNGANGTVLAGYSNIFAGVEKILSVNAPMPTAAIMAPRSLVKLGGLVDTTGQPLQVPGMLQNVKLLQTSQLPINQTVGTSTDCSEIYLGDFTQMFFAMREQMSFQVLDQAYAQFGQIAFICHCRVDILVQYPQAFCLISGVR